MSNCVGVNILMKTISILDIWFQDWDGKGKYNKSTFYSMYKSQYYTYYLLYILIYPLIILQILKWCSHQVQSIYYGLVPNLTSLHNFNAVMLAQQNIIILDPPLCIFTVFHLLSIYFY